MATIEPKQETVTKEYFVMTYDRSELEAFVKDPKPYLREIRAVLNSSNKPPLKPAAAKKTAPKKANWATAGYAGHTARNKKTADDKPGFRCRKGCSRTFKREGNRDNHESKCLGGDPEIGSYQPAAAAE